MISVKYIGNKDEKFDNVAGTNLVWGKGEVIDVEDQVARKLVRYTDTWVAVDMQGCSMDPVSDSRAGPPRHIKYVGTRANKPDSVAGSSLVWAPGQAHVVTDPVAVKLFLKHPDVWVEVFPVEETPVEAVEAVEQAEPEVSEEPEADEPEDNDFVKAVRAGRPKPKAPARRTK